MQGPSASPSEEGVGDLTSEVQALCDYTDPAELEYPYGHPRKSKSTRIVLPIKKTEFDQLFQLLNRVVVEKPANFNKLLNKLHVRLWRALPLTSQDDLALNTMIATEIKNAFKGRIPQFDKGFMDKFWGLVEKEK